MHGSQLYGKYLPILLTPVICMTSVAQDLIRNQSLSVAVRQEDGAYEVRATRSHTPVVRASIGALINHHWTNSRQYPSHHTVRSTFHNLLGKGQQVTVTFTGLPNRPTLAYTLRVYDNLPFGEIEVEVHNNTHRKITVQAVRSLDTVGHHVLNLGDPESSERVLSDGFSESDVSIYDLERGTAVTGRAIGSQLLYNRNTGKSVFFGALTSNLFVTFLRLQVGTVQGRPSVTSFSIDSTGTTEARSMAPWFRGLPKEEQVELSLPLAPGETLSAERLMFSVGLDYHAQLAEYGLAVRQLHHARVSGPNLMGWWSWNAHYLNINESNILANAQWLSEHLKSSGYNFFHIDEGYASLRGEYLNVNSEKFPNGMRSLSHEISRIGLNLGIWVAPLEVSERAPIARYHQDWFVRDNRRHPIWFYGSRDGERCYVLDVTQPEARKYLENTFQTLVKDWGAKYIKLDFMDLTAVEGYYYRPQTTAMEAQRIALQTIRNVVGEDVLLDKDGSPMLNPVGIVDEGRISGDTKHSFRAWKESALGLVARYYMHRNFFVNDPDAFTLQREIPPTQIGASSSQAKPLTLNEAQMSITLAALSGGMFEIGDDLPTLATDPKRLALVTNPDLLQIAKNGKAATPLDLLDYSSEDLQPSVSFLREDSGQSVLAVFNWTDSPRSHAFALSSLGLTEGHSYSVYDVFNHDSLDSMLTGNFLVINDQAPHSVKLIKITDRAHSSGSPAIILNAPHSTNGL